MKRFLFSAVLLMVGASEVSAKVYDASNQRYQMTGSMSAKIVSHCGVFTLRASPIEFSEEFLIQFSEQVEPVVIGDIVGTFHITDHKIDGKIQAAGQMDDGEIAERKNNKLILQYTGLSQIESSEKLKDLIHDKALNHGTDLGDELTVTGYSFKAYVRKDSLKFVEVEHILIPNYPRSGCKGNLKVKRKLFGSVVVPVA